MRRVWIALLALLPGVALAATVLPGPTKEGVRLHDGWTISPMGTAIGVGTLPLALAPLAGQRVAVQLSGFAENGIDIVDFSTGKRQRLVVPKSWLGLAAAANSKTLYLSGAADNVVHEFILKDGIWEKQEPIRVAPEGSRAFIAGLFLDEPRGRVLACENLANRVAVIDVVSRRVMSEFPTGSDPYAVVVTPDGTRAFVSNWGDSSLTEITLDGSRPAKRIASASHPTALALDRGGKRLFVACAQDDLVSVVDVEKGLVVHSVSMTLSPGDPEGATPTSLALSPDGTHLYVANSDNNDVAVLRITDSDIAVEGFLPAGRYPTAVAVDAGGNLLVADGKGARQLANPNGPQPVQPMPGSKNPKYILNLLTGDVRRIASADLADISRPTRAVLRNRPVPPEEKLHPAYGKIRHVIYVIKENRTYDQVFGDEPRGNGDPSLTLFGRAVSPNHHAIAEEFVLLDNFYCNAEVSAQGHNWSTGAFSNDYVEKTFPQNYSDRERDYDYEGEREIAAPRSGYLWDAAKRKGITYRSYGEFIENGVTSDVPATTRVAALEGHFDPMFRSFDTNYPDTRRIDEWLSEFRAFERSGKLPALEIVRLPDDHTAGTKAGSRTPAAMMAANDLALGRLVEAVSGSRFFADTAIFTVEDDAQNGPDHVDCHRSVVLVVSPYTPRRKRDSRMYTTASVIATIGKILGFPAFSQYDARAERMDYEFSGPFVRLPFTALPAGVSLEEMNDSQAPMARESASLDFSREDAAPDAILNEILYRAVQGRGAPAPTVRFGVRTALSADADGD